MANRYGTYLCTNLPAFAADTSAVRVKTAMWGRQGDLAKSAMLVMACGDGIRRLRERGTKKTLTPTHRWRTEAGGMLSVAKMDVDRRALLWTPKVHDRNSSCRLLGESSLQSCKQLVTVVF